MAEESGRGLSSTPIPHPNLLALYRVLGIADQALGFELVDRDTITEVYHRKLLVAGVRQTLLFFMGVTDFTMNMNNDLFLVYTRLSILYAIFRKAGSRSVYIQRSLEVEAARTAQAIGTGCDA